MPIIVVVSKASNLHLGRLCSHSYSLRNGAFFCKDGGFRTPSVNVDFVHKLLMLKEKGLLFLEQPFNSFEEKSSCGDSDYPLQHIQELFRIIREIYKNKKRMDDNGNV